MQDEVSSGARHRTITERPTYRPNSTGYDFPRQSQTVVCERGSARVSVQVLLQVRGHVDRLRWGQVDSGGIDRLNIHVCYSFCESGIATRSVLTEVARRSIGVGLRSARRSSRARAYRERAVDAEVPVIVAASTRLNPSQWISRTSSRSWRGSLVMAARMCSDSSSVDFGAIRRRSVIARCRLASPISTQRELGNFYRTSRGTFLDRGQPVPLAPHLQPSARAVIDPNEHARRRVEIQDNIGIGCDAHSRGIVVERAHPGQARLRPIDT